MRRTPDRTLDRDGALVMIVMTSRANLWNESAPMIDTLLKTFRHP